MEVRHAVGSLDRTEGDLRIDEASFGILRLVEGSDRLARSDREEAVLRGVLQRLIRVEEVLPVRGELPDVPASLWGEDARLATVDADRGDDTVNGAQLRGAVDDGLTAVSEAEEVSDLPLATGDLPEELPIDIVAIEVRVAVTTRLPDELLITPRDEAHRPLGLDVLIVVLREEGLDVVARSRVVGLEVHVILLTVDLCDVDRLTVRSPRDIRQVLLLRLTRLDVGGLPRSHVIDPEGHVVAGHTSHGVIELLLGSLAGIDMNEGIRSHHTLVHAIEGQTAPIGTPEEPAIDPELILMHALSIDECGRAIGRQLLRRAIGEEEEEVVVSYSHSVLSTRSQSEGLLSTASALEGCELLLRLWIDEVMLLAEGDEEPLIYNGEGREVLSPRTLCRLADDREELILTQQGLLWVSGRRRADHEARAIDVHIVATEPAKGAE